LRPVSVIKILIPYFNYTLFIFITNVLDNVTPYPCSIEVYLQLPFFIFMNFLYNCLRKNNNYRGLNRNIEKKMVD